MAASFESVCRKMNDDIQEMLMRIKYELKSYAGVKVAQHRKGSSSRIHRNQFRASREHRQWAKQIRKLREVGHTDDIYRAESPIHNFGVFTKRLIKAQTFIIEYTGEIMDKEEQERRDQMGYGDYFAAFTDGKVIDAYWKGNLSKFINHSCEPNCALELVDSGQDVTAIVVTASRDIQPMEELSFDYKFEDSDPTNELLRCNCRSQTCRGYVNDTQNGCR